MTPFSDVDLILNKDGSVYHLSLKPNDISENIILVGDPGRVHLISRHFDEVDFEMNKREFITHTGKYKGKRISVMSTGMGSDNIEIVMVELDALFNIDLKKREPKKEFKQLNIVRIGTSASLQQGIKTDTELASDYAIGLGSVMAFYNLPQDKEEKEMGDKLQEHFKFNFKPFCVRGSVSLREKLAFDLPTGNTLTCPGFYMPQGRRIRIEGSYPNLLNDLMYFHHNDMWLTNFEMETAALYAMGRLLGHETISLNAIIANRVDQTFSKNPNKSISTIIKKVLDRF